METTMTATSHDRGWPIYWDGHYWRYSDTGAISDHKRPRAHCGGPPTSEGYDACLGYLPGVSSARCGHGITGRVINMRINNNENQNDQA